MAARRFQKVLYKDENIGAAGVRIDPSDPNIVYATLWEAREGPWENGEWNGTGGGIFKSTDGGQTWQPLAGGLPDGIVQAYVSIARSNPKSLFAVVATKDKVDLYRSEDAGATWSIVTTDARPKPRIGGGDLPVPLIDPKNPDVVYVTSTVTWKSMDGGETWSGFRGAPGGDDYQNIWINPNDPNIIVLTSDQGAIVSVNGGQTWSSWYNQPTAQMYHVNADNAFPYRLCSGQQESGSVCISSRGNDGEITFRDWHPVAAEEYGYVVARSARPGHDFRRQTDALRPAHRAGAEHHAGAAGLAGLPCDPHRTDRFLAVRSRIFSTLPRTRCGRRAMADAVGSRSAPT